MASTGGAGKCTSPASQAQCDRMRDGEGVIVQNSIRRPRTLESEQARTVDGQIRKDVLDSVQDVGARHASNPGVVAICIQGRFGRTKVVETAPSRVCTRTSTSVIVNCRPENSMRSRQSARPRRSSDVRRASPRVRSDGVLEVLHTPWKLEDNGQPHAAEHRRAPQTLNCPGAVSLIARYAGRDSCAVASSARKAGRAAGRQAATRCRASRASRGALSRRFAACRCIVSRRGQKHYVPSRAVLIRLLPRERLLLGEPRLLHVGLTPRSRHAAGNQRINEHEMPTKPGLDRSLHDPATAS